jgi:hypothetical protein
LKGCLVVWGKLKGVFVIELSWSLESGRKKRCPRHVLLK